MKSVLNKCDEYNLLSFLSDVVNTVVLIASLGIFLLITGQFRLFEFNPNKKLANEVVSRAEKEVKHFDRVISGLNASSVELESFGVILK